MNTTDGASVVAPASHISDADVLYLHKLVQGRQLAQFALDQFVAHLGQVYQMGPTDTIDVSGTITRNPAKEPGA